MNTSYKIVVWTKHGIETWNMNTKYFIIAKSKIDRITFFSKFPSNNVLSKLAGPSFEFIYPTFWPNLT